MFLGIDVGTTTIKVGCYPQQKAPELLCKEYPLYLEGKSAYQFGADWHNGVRDLLRALQLKRRKETVDAVCVGGQGITFLPVDREGKILYRAVSWLDTDAVAETETVSRLFPEAWLYETTGKRISPAYTLPKLMRFKKQHPDLYRRTYKFLFPADYINFLLTGQAVTDYTLASGSMMFDIHACDWSEEILSACEIDRKKLPDLKVMGSSLGGIRPDAADDFGLPAGIEVILGGQDQKLSAVGVGLRGNSAAVSLGTSTAVEMFLPMQHAAVFAFDGRRMFYEFVLNTTGAAIKWLKNLLSLPSYADMDALAAQADGAGGIAFNPDFVCGADVGPLKLDSDRGNIIYALYEGIARGIALLLPAGTERLILFGGGANSEVLCRIIARITGKEVARPDSPETVCRGAAVLASGGTIQYAEVRRLDD